MRKNNVIKSVSFNETNPDDRKMLKYIKRRNFSGYMKKLLLADIEAREQEASQNNPVSTQPEAIAKEKYEPASNHPIDVPQPQKAILSTTERLEQMKRQTKKTGNGASQPKSFINPQ